MDFEGLFVWFLFLFALLFGTFSFNHCIVYPYLIYGFCLVFSSASYYLFFFMVFNFQQYFSYIVTVSFINGRNRRTRRKPLTCRKSLKNFYHIMLYTSPWSRLELKTSVMIGTVCIGSCKSDYHTITLQVSLISVDQTRHELVLPPAIIYHFVSEWVIVV